MVDANIGKVLADRYRVDSHVSDSDGVTLYRGTNIVLDRPVMIKVLTPGSSDPQQFLEKAKLDPDLRDFGTNADGSAFAVYQDLNSAASAQNNIWKTAFVVLAGITLLAAALIYATSVKQTHPTTQLQLDANGQPVQPINPATGLQEQSLSNMQGMADANSTANMAVPPGTLPGGDGFDAWRNGGAPPPGGPPIGAGGQVVTIDPNNPSPFMSDAGCVMQPSGVLLCPVPLANSAAKPTPTPRKTAAANANVQASPTPQTPVPATNSSPAANRPAARPSPQRTPAAANTRTPTARPGDRE